MKENQVPDAQWVNLPEVSYRSSPNDLDDLRLSVLPGVVIAMAVEAVGRTVQANTAPKTSHAYVLALLNNTDLDRENFGYATARGGQKAATQAARYVGADPRRRAKFAQVERAFWDGLSDMSRTEVEEKLSLVTLFTDYRTADTNEKRHQAESALLDLYDPIINGHIDQCGNRADALDRAMITFYTKIAAVDISQNNFADVLDQALSTALRTKSVLESQVG